MRERVGAPGTLPKLLAWMRWSACPRLAVIFGQERRRYLSQGGVVQASQLKVAVHALAQEILLIVLEDRVRFTGWKRPRVFSLSTA